MKNIQTHIEKIKSLLNEVKKQSNAIQNSKPFIGEKADYILTTSINRIDDILNDIQLIK